MAGIESSRQPISGGEVQWDVYPSVQLFVRRVAARAGSFALTDKEAPFVAEMCRKLDGLPLAIELAAGQVAALGLRNTFARLVFRMELLRLSHRTAVLRHRTLKGDIGLELQSVV
jgi:predicted ATPase